MFNLMQICKQGTNSVGILKLKLISKYIDQQYSIASLDAAVMIENWNLREL